MVVIVFLIIIAALETKLADEIYAEAIRHNLSVIVEVHDSIERKCFKIPKCFNWD